MTLKHPSFFLLLLISLAIVSCSDSKKEEAKESVKFVKVEKVRGGSQGGKMVFNGKIKEKSLTSLSFRVGGPLVKLNVKEGDFVRKGQTIAQIDKRDYLLNIQSTKAQYEQLTGEYERYKELFNKKKIPANSYEKIESGYLMAKTAYENATNKLVDTELKAPVSGYIYERFTENHQTVAPGMPIVSIIDLSDIEVVVSVAENQLLAVKNSEESFLTVKNAKVEKLPISLLSIGEKTKKDGLFEVKYSLKKSEDLPIFPGMSAEVTMFSKGSTEALSVPSGALFTQDGKNCVWVYDAEAKKVVRREVNVKRIASEGKIELISGLKVGEEIVTAGVYSLQNNQSVLPIEKPSETNIGGIL
ncbi:efflux RND transporter periplasmic adaptor subunit [Flammeovirgaceae bacterium SG7u.111]|nr:efflux RND transporter periplasmic adaptor subunit [Flammeovirgaceae bacterium SG7u.132]WPO36088.1 efflux RND transporter periplasmic adaptor subunit [Flammeovirgaceae bacterium SG7u.111]